MVLSRGYPTEFASYFHNYSSLQFDYLKKTLRISSSVKVFSLTMAPVLACLLPSKTLIGNRAERMEGKVGGLLQILLEREFRASCYFWYFIKAKNPVTNEPTISKEVLVCYLVRTSPGQVGHQEGQLYLRGGTPGLLELTQTCPTLT
ncbi:hypothetical protein MLD38_007888 [Melastoma candidum]|uniref:Uncharacterized protein n=1 Tax=Melastoma candidum TaxID=119954 RepID=A0ACB9RT35_9MYRT|nr:hypothetical protein MLD38_007888 [Melastoma candidum]